MFRRRELPLKLVTKVVASEIIGNRNSKIYHLSTCPDYNKVSVKNREMFASEEIAKPVNY